jgi:hypothetical protein
VTNSSNAATGYIGEVAYANDSVGTNATGSWQNLLSLSLTAGDWQVTGQVTVDNAGANPSIGGNEENLIALSQYSAGTTTDHVMGDNQIGIYVHYEATYSDWTSATIANWRINTTTTGYVYLKCDINAATGGPPVTYSRLSARRMR